jgi:hypothetical protein
MITKKSVSLRVLLVATAISSTSLVIVGTAAAESIPAAPSNLQVSPVQDRLFFLRWASNSNNETGFEISDGISSRRTGPGQNSDYWEVEPGTYKCFKVRAFNSAGSSAWHPGSSPYYVCGTTRK